MYGQAFAKCSGCSELITNDYKENQLDFLFKVCNNPDYLEDVTGITEMNNNINFDDIESFGSDMSI